MAGGGKNKLEFVKQDTPKFLRDFKARVNYKEGPTVQTKKQQISRDDDEQGDVEKEDEKPTICVLKEGDLTEEEYNLYRKDDNGMDSVKNSSIDKRTGSSPSNGKIIFEKPLKRKKEMESNQKSTKESSNRKDKKSSKILAAPETKLKATMITNMENIPSPGHGTAQLSYSFQSSSSTPKSTCITRIISR